MIPSPTVVEAIRVLRAAWSRECATTADLARVARLPVARCRAIAQTLRGEQHDTGREVGAPVLLMYDDDDDASTPTDRRAEPPALTLAGRDVVRAWAALLCTRGVWPPELRLAD